MLLLEDKFSKIINELKIPTQFGIDIDDAGIGSTFEDFSWNLHKKFPDCFIGNGCSKAVIDIPGTDYVIKIPFNGAWYLSEYENEYGDYDEYFCEFDNTNYCATEEERYELAEENGFEEFFAKTWYSGVTIDYTDIYLQEKIIPFTESDSKCSKESRESAKEISRQVNCYVDLDWIGMAVEWYGADRTTQFLEFIHNNYIDDDLHNGNIGYRMNGQPILFDYSSFDY